MCFYLFDRLSGSNNSSFAAQAKTQLQMLRQHSFDMKQSKRTKKVLAYITKRQKHTKITKM